MDMTCWPAGASEGSASVGTVTSRNGRRENSPYLEASKARSMESISGPMWILPESVPLDAPSSALNCGGPESARLILATAPFER